VCGGNEVATWFGPPERREGFWRGSTTDGLAAHLKHCFFRLVIQPKDRSSFFSVAFLSGDLHAEWGGCGLCGALIRTHLQPFVPVAGKTQLEAANAAKAPPPAHSTISTQQGSSG
jgi:hypothetical protein